MPLAEEYQCSKLKERCENYLVNFLSKNTETQPAFKSLLFSCTYGLKKAIEASANVLCDRSLSTLQKNELWQLIPDEGKYMVCMKRTLKLENSGDTIMYKMHSLDNRIKCNKCSGYTTISSNQEFIDFARDKINSTNKTC